MRRERGVVHIIEPQQLFVPILFDVFAEADLEVARVTEEIEPQALLDSPPDLLFLDSDYLDDPFRSVRLAHVLAPDAAIVVYTDAQGPATYDAFIAAGATRVLAKSAGRGDVVKVLRGTVERRNASRDR